MVTHERMLSTAAHAIMCMRDTSETRWYAHQDGDTWTAYIHVGQSAEYLRLQYGPRGHCVTHATGVSGFRSQYSIRGIAW